MKFLFILLLPLSVFSQKTFKHQGKTFEVKEFANQFTLDSTKELLKLNTGWSLPDTAQCRSMEFELKYNGLRVLTSTTNQGEMIYAILNRQPVFFIATDFGTFDQRQYYNLLLVKEI